MTEEEFMIEEWKTITGYTNYSVSNMGRVRNDRHNTLLTPQEHVQGYQLVTLYNNNGYGLGGTKKMFTVHSLVMGAHVGPRPHDYDIDHIDRDVKNNHVDNLEYVTHRENVKRGRLSKYDYIICTDVINPTIIIKYKSVNDAIKDGYTKECVYQCISGRNKHIEEKHLKGF